MATKKTPGKYDAYAKADPDEPLFVLLGRDPVAPALIRLWAEIHAELGDTPKEKIDEALECAKALTAWAESHGQNMTLADQTRTRVQLLRSATILQALAESMKSAPAVPERPIPRR